MHGGSAGGYTAQAIGLEYTTASRGAFTGTFTVLAVPILVRPTHILAAMPVMQSCTVHLAAHNLITWHAYGHIHSFLFLLWNQCVNAVGFPECLRVWMHMLSNL